MCALTLSFAALVVSAPTLDVHGTAGGHGYFQNNSPTVGAATPSMLSLAAEKEMPMWLQGLSLRGSLHLMGSDGSLPTGKQLLDVRLDELRLGAGYVWPKAKWRDRLEPFVAAELALGRVGIHGQGHVEGSVWIPGMVASLGAKFFFGGYHETLGSRRFYIVTSASYALRMPRTAYIGGNDDTEENEEPINTVAVRLGTINASGYQWDLGFGMRF